LWAKRKKIGVNLDRIKDAAEKSEWVRGMIKYEELDNGEIHLPQTDPETFKNFLKILRDDKSAMAGNLEDVMDVLCLSHMWDFPEVISKCCDHYRSKILVNYNFIFSNVAMLDLENTLDEDSFYLLKWNVKEAFNKKCYLKWGTPAWIRVLECNNISLDEIAIFKAVQEWQKTNNICLWEVRRLMPLIRFSSMKKADFEKYVPFSGFLEESEIDNIRKQPGSFNSTPRRFELGIDDGIDF